MANELPRLTTRTGITHAESDVIQATLQLLQEQLAGDAGRTRCLLVIGAELAFEGEVDALRLLLFAKLQTVANDLGLAVAAMLAGGEVTLLDRALIGESTWALSEKASCLRDGKGGRLVRYNVPIHFSLVQRPTGLRIELSFVPVLNFASRSYSAARFHSTLWPLQQLIAAVGAFGIHHAGALGTKSTFVATNKSSSAMQRRILSGSHYTLRTSPLRRTAAVMRNRRDVANRPNIESGRCQSAHRGFAARARSGNPNIY